ncbi:MAG: DUF2490 domain-containing protein [Bacteroidaceae bacterium]|nr:DUF2490 domain-containing protein [Bacteroidaceae bacterium]
MKRIISILLLAIPLTVSAQDTETGYTSDEATRTTGALWTELSAVKGLSNDLSLGIDAGFRTDDGISQASRYDIGLSLSWKPNKHWKFGVGYTFLMKHYNAETAYKDVTERGYNFKRTSDGLDSVFTSFPGATYNATADKAYYTDGDGNKYRYQGYTDTHKDYARITESYWRVKHRISLDAAYTQRLWKTLRITLRERYQMTLIPSKTVSQKRTGTKTENDYSDPIYDALTASDMTALAGGDMTAWSLITYDDVDKSSSDASEASEKTKKSKDTHVLRSRLTFEIDKKGWHWTPYLYVEPFNNLGESFHVDKLRLSAGVDYSISKQHKIGIAYVFNHENDDDGDENIHAVSISYRFKF